MPSSSGPARPTEPWDRSQPLGRDLLERRFPQYLAVYLGASWGLIEFVAFLEDRFLLSPHWTNLVMLALLLLLPSVALFIYYHGRKGADRWQRIEKVAIPVNVVLVIVVIFGAFSGKDLGAVTTTVTVEDEEGNPIERVVPKTGFRKSLALFVPAPDSTDPDREWLGYAVYAGLINELWQDNFLNLRPTRLFREELREAGYFTDAEAPRALKRQVTRDARIPFFVDGSISRSDDGFRLTLSLNDAERGRVIVERVHTGGDLFALVDSASVALRRDLGIPVRHLEETLDLPVREHTTGSMTALRAYARGAEALLVRDDYPAARAALEEALDEDPHFADAAYSLFGVLGHMGELDAASAALQVAMDNLYRLPERYHYMVKGEWYALHQDYPRLFAVMEMWAELFPEDIAAQLARARIRSYQDDRRGAIAAYERVLELDPTQVELLSRIGSLYESIGDTAAARAYYERHLEAAPRDGTSIRALGALYRRAGGHDAARELYERALLLDPGDAELVVTLASLDRDVGRFDAARAALERTLVSARTSEQRSRVLTELSGLDAFRGQWGRALEHMERALDEGEGFRAPVLQIQYRMLTLDLHVRAGQAERALAILDSLAGRLQPPQDALVPIGRMEVFEAMEIPDSLARAIEAARAVQESSGMNTIRGQLAYFTGRLHEMRGEWRRAATAYEEERAHDPADVMVPARIGRCRGQLGELEAAESLIRETLAAVPAHGRSHYELALVYERMGRNGEAVAHLGRALETLAPADEGDPWAARARERLAALGG